MTLNPIWTELFANLKRLGEDDETWSGYTMDRSLYKLPKIFYDAIVMLIL